MVSNVPKLSLNAHKAGESSRASRKLGRQGWQELRIELDCGACGPGKQSNSARPIWLVHVSFQGVMTESGRLCLRVCPCRQGADFAADAQIAAFRRRPRKLGLDNSGDAAGVHPTGLAHTLLQLLLLVARICDCTACSAVPWSDTPCWT